MHFRTTAPFAISPIALAAPDSNGGGTPPEQVETMEQQRDRYIGEIGSAGEVMATELATRFEMMTQDLAKKYASALNSLENRSKEVKSDLLREAEELSATIKMEVVEANADIDAKILEARDVLAQIQSATTYLEALLKKLPQE